MDGVEVGTVAKFVDPSLKNSDHKVFDYLTYVLDDYWAKLKLSQSIRGFLFISTVTMTLFVHFELFCQLVVTKLQDEMNL